MFSREIFHTIILHGDHTVYYNIGISCKDMLTKFPLSCDDVLNRYTKKRRNVRDARGRKYTRGWALPCGLLHSPNADTPAIVLTYYSHDFTIETDKYWYYKGLIHRGNDLVARIRGQLFEWYTFGVNYRPSGGPSNEYIPGIPFFSWYKQWRNQVGQLHRDNDQPAFITSEGECIWYCNGEIHRDGDKPAIITKTKVEYYYHDVLICSKKIYP